MLVVVLLHPQLPHQPQSLQGQMQIILQSFPPQQVEMVLVQHLMLVEVLLEMYYL
jgi:hypothetical protein